MNGVLYIVPTALLTPGYPATTHCAQHEIPADPTLSLVVVDWAINPNAQVEFESQPGVLPLGERWEALPAEALPLLASMQDVGQNLLTGTVTISGVDGLPATPVTVSQAIKGIAWGGVKLAR